MTTSTSPKTRYLLALGVSVGTVLFLLLGIGALGIVGDGDRDAVYLVATDQVSASLGDVVMLTGMYAALFAFAAWLFSRVRVSAA